jgi:hypothetical protein
MDRDRLIAALEQELAGYLRRGLPDRADQVREELRRLGGSVPTIAETVPTEPASTPQKPTTSVRKPVERVKDAEGIKTPKKPKRGS